MCSDVPADLESRGSEGGQRRPPKQPVSSESKQVKDQAYAKLAVVTDEYFVSNTLGFLVDDLPDDDRFADLADAERTAALPWVMDEIIRCDGFQGWIEELGHRSAET